MRQHHGWNALLLLSLAGASSLCQPIPHCQTRDLSIREADGGVAMGQIFSDYVLTNHGDHACRLSGYPTAVAFNDRMQAVLEILFRHGLACCGAGLENQRVRILRLNPGAHAWFQIASSDGMGLDDLSLCHKATQVRITPPNNDKPFQKLFQFGSCTPEAGISLLLPGEPPF